MHRHRPVRRVAVLAAVLGTVSMAAVAYALDLYYYPGRALLVSYVPALALAGLALPPRRAITLVVLILGLSAYHLLREEGYSNDGLLRLSCLAVGGLLSVLASRQNTITEQLVHAVEDALEARATFITMALHDLRNAISSGSVAGAALARRHGEDRQALTIDRSFRRVVRLLDDIRDADLLERHAFAVARRAADLGRVTFDTLAGQDPARVRCECSRVVPVECDPDRIGQVIENLVVNALRHTTGNVTVRVSAPARVEVIDEGPMIPVEERDKLFRPFSRLAFAQADGTGLGLYICRGIIEAHGGRIGVGSLGKGNVFFFELPPPATARSPHVELQLPPEEVPA